MDWFKPFSSFVLFLILNGGIASAQNVGLCPKPTLPNGQVRLQNRGYMASFTCNRGFDRVGPRFSVCLNTGQWTQKTPMCVGNGCRPIPAIPNLEVQSLFNGAVLKFLCKPGFYRNGPEQILCDGFQWSTEAPTCAEGVSLGCDFEKEGICGWSQDQTDDFDWSWHKGHTPTSGTGPSADHTTTSTDGHYLYIESSAPTKKNHKARLISPGYRAADLAYHCLQFFYHMRGPEGPDEMGHLEVYVHPASASTSVLYPANLIFSAKTNTGDQWQKADVEIPPQTESVMIIFQGIRMKSWNSDIAIDDVKLYSCPEGPESLAESTTSQKETTETTSPPNSTVGADQTATTMPTSSGDTSSTGNSTTDGSTSASGSAINETTMTSSSGNASSENVTMTTDQSSDGTTSGVDKGQENSTVLTFRPSHEDGDGQGRTEDAASMDSRPAVRNDMNQQARTAATASTSSEILPIILGVLLALVIVVIFVAVVVWAVARRKQKRDDQIEDELNIISKSTESK